MVGLGTGTLASYAKPGQKADIYEIDPAVLRLSDPPEGGERYFWYLHDARKRGVAFGRPPKMRPDQQKPVHELLNQGRSISEIARTFNVHPANIYRCREASEGL